MTDTPLPEQLDGEPDLAAEITRIDSDIRALAESLMPSDEQLKADIAALEISDADYASLIANLDQLIPEDALAEAPTSTSRLDQLMWRVTTATKSLTRPRVPGTDDRRPTLETPAEDFSTLPPHVRMARGYTA